MASLSSRVELIDYCLRRLGAPVIEINVDEDQVEDRIDEALQYFQEYNSDGIVETFFKYQITAADMTNEYITLPEELVVVKRVLPLSGSNSSSSNFLSAQYQINLDSALTLRDSLNGGLASYSMTKSNIETMNMMFGNAQVRSRFSRNMDRLFIDTDWGIDIIENDWIIVEGSKIIDPEAFTDIYNDRFLKKYATALIKRQWGSNMSKFEGMQLPGGVIMNGRQIFDDALIEIEKIEEQMQLMYEMPVDMQVG
jgi:hypothetical protein